MKGYEKRLYQNNILGYNLVIGFVALNMIYCLFTLKNMALDYKIGIFIMTNIVLSLVSFLSAAKVKNYSILWSYITFVIGIFQLARYFLEKGIHQSKPATYISMCLIMSIFFIFIGSLISIFRSTKRKNYVRKCNANIELVSNKGDLK